MSSDRLIPLGSYLLQALAETADVTGDLITSFRPAHDALVARLAARSTAKQANVAPRVTLRFAERRLEQAVRRLSSAAEGLDGRSRGPIWSALFTDGLDAEIRPRSNAQKAASEELRQRLELATIAEPLRSDHGAVLDSTLAGLTAALDAREAASNAFGLAFAQEQAAREDFVRSYDAMAGAIRQRFPGDRPRQDIYFDTFRRGRSGGEPVVTDAT